MDYLCAKFGNFTFSRFGFIVQTNRITVADTHANDATTVGVSNLSPPSSGKSDQVKQGGAQARGSEDGSVKGVGNLAHFEHKGTLFNMDNDQLY